MQTRLPKYRRTEASRQAVGQRQITDRSLDIIETIARYRFITTALLVRLSAGNEDVTHRHLQTLFHQGWINRFHIPRPGHPSQFIYYLDNGRVLNLFKESGRETGALDPLEIKRNHANAYYRVNDACVPEEEKPSLLFIRHELMITRFQACLELACQASGGAARLLTFTRKRSNLKHGVQAPKLERTLDQEGREVWTESAEHEWLPHIPDAFLTLHLNTATSGGSERSFFYEADRQTESLPAFAKKLRAHHQFIVRQRYRRYLETHYGVSRIRAVLIETTTPQWAEKLRLEAATSPVVCPKPSILFWFMPSTLLTLGRARADEREVPRREPYFLNNAHILLSPIWATPVHDQLYSFFD